MISISLKDAFPHKRSVACTEAIADTNDNQTDPKQADGRDAFVEVKSKGAATCGALFLIHSHAFMLS